MTTFQIHWRSILEDGYETHREAIDVKFPFQNHDRTIERFSVGFVDGHTKVLAIQSMKIYKRPYICLELQVIEQFLCYL